jgi:hypothetical protein
LGKVINLVSCRKPRATWDKPLTTEYASNKNTCKLYYFKEHKRKASSDKRRASSGKLQALEIIVNRI